jgi:hypothetical protein
MDGLEGSVGSFGFFGRMRDVERYVDILSNFMLGLLQ